MGGAWKDFEEHDRPGLNRVKRASSRNPDSEDAAAEGTKGSEGHVIRTWRRSVLVVQ